MGFRAGMRALSDQVSEKVVLRCLSFIYLLAFSSLFIQIPGLYGSDGLEPVHSFLSRIAQKRYDKHTTWGYALNAFSKLPTLVWFHAPLGLSVDSAMDGICFIGMVLSTISCLGFGNQAIMFGMWICYLSLYQVGQTFLGFQWDKLLCEVGWAATLLSTPLFSTNSISGNHPAMLLLRWILFKLMFMSGVVKIQANCPTWLHLTACHYHFATQCIPTPLAWHFHNLPGFLLKLMVALTLYFEMPAALLVLAPWQCVRLFAAGVQIFLQVLIIATGNYTFFNLLTIALCFSLIDDCIWKRLSLRELYKWRRSRIQGPPFSLPKVSFLKIVILVTCGLLLSFFCMFSVRTDRDGELDIALRVSVQDVNTAVQLVLPCTILMFGAGITLSALSFVGQAWCSDAHPKGQKVVNCIIALLVSGAVLTTYTAGIPGILSLDQQGLGKMYASTWKSGTQLWQFGQALGVTGSYGLFRRMTGVGGKGQIARPEVEFLGSHDGVSWFPIAFKYKPGSVSRSPPWVAPHQPRLDWQMWFAALGSPEHAPWCIHLAQKLLEGSRPVRELLGHNPDLDKPPVYIKAERYEYDFTKPSWGRERMGPGNQPVQTNNSSEWWTRRQSGSYLPPVKLGDLDSYLEHFGWYPPPSSLSRQHRQLPPPLSWLVACFEGASTLVRDSALTFTSLCIILSGTWNLCLIVRSVLFSRDDEVHSAQCKQEKIE